MQLRVVFGVLLLLVVVEHSTGAGPQTLDEVKQCVASLSEQVEDFEKYYVAKQLVLGVTQNFKCLYRALGNNPDTTDVALDNPEKLELINYEPFGTNSDVFASIVRIFRVQARRTNGEVTLYSLNGAPLLRAYGFAILAEILGAKKTVNQVKAFLGYQNTKLHWYSPDVTDDDIIDDADDTNYAENFDLAEGDRPKDKIAVIETISDVIGAQMFWLLTKFSSGDTYKKTSYNGMGNRATIYSVHNSLCVVDYFFGADDQNSAPIQDVSSQYVREFEAYIGAAVLVDMASVDFNNALKWGNRYNIPPEAKSAEQYAAFLLNTYIYGKDYVYDGIRLIPDCFLEKEKVAYSI